MEKRSVRRGRKISLEGAKCIGSGYASWVFAMEDGNVVKVLKQGDEKEAEREILLAKWAFTAGIPTAISYDVVDIDGRPGLVYESLGRGNLRNAFRDEPERFEALLTDYLTLLHTIHRVTDDEGRLPAAIDKYRAALEKISDLLTPEERKKAAALLDTIPDSRTIIHGDCQIKNVRVVKGKLFLIDLDTLSRGDPIFELASIFCCYRGYPALSEDPYDHFFEIEGKTLARISDGLLNGYYPGLPENARMDNARKVALLGWLAMIAIVREDYPEDTAGLARMLRNFRDVLGNVEDLRLICAV